jgi:hypothetical protein
MSDKITGLTGGEIAGLKATTAQKHSMVKHIYGSASITQEKKDGAFAKLKEIDSSDLLTRTERYCESVIPTLEAKREAYNTLLDGVVEQTLQEMMAICYGCRKFGQRHLLAQLNDLFFEKIEQCVSKQAYARTRYIYIMLAPTLIADDAIIARFESFKNEIESRDEKDKIEGNDRLVKWLKESIQELKEKKDARALSSEWERQRPKL